MAKDPGGSAGYASDSVVYLNPDPVKNTNEFFMITSVSQAIKDELAGGDTSFTGWSFDYSLSTLNGVLYIDQYKAGYKADHHGGGEIELRYEKGDGDPVNLRWIQLISTSVPLDPPGALGPPTSPYIDPYPNDNDAADGPFYYFDAPAPGIPGGFDIANHIDGAIDYGFGTDYDLHFYDYSSRGHPLPIPFDPITWSAELYLVEWDGDKTVTFHDGIKWGWVMQPVPEPGTFALLASGIACYAGYMYMRRRRIPGRTETPEA